MIRVAKLEDGAEIQQLIQPYITDFSINLEGEQKFSRAALDDLLQQAAVHYFVYERADQVIAVIAYREPVHILHFFVDQAYQGQGIGRMLWNHLLQQFEFGNRLQFSVNSSCYAVPIYQKFGFQCISDICEYSGLRFIKMIHIESEIT